jgi:hypothetical protein
MVLPVEFPCPLRGDILDFRYPVNGSFLVIDFFDDPPYLLLIQFPHWNWIIYLLFQEKVISGKDKKNNLKKKIPKKRKVQKSSTLVSSQGVYPK